MRALLGLGLFLVVAACGRIELWPSADAGGDAGTPVDAGSPDAGSTTDAGTPDAGVACHGLSEIACRHTEGCRANTCFACTCTPSFVGCTANTEPTVQCPAMGCPSPQCCHTTGECGSSGATCAPPGTPRGCGACMPDVPGICSTDAQCPVGQMCRISESCSCVGSRACVAGCTSDAQCDDGEQCDGLHHCVARTCVDATACPVSFTCTSGHCARKTCTSSDAECNAAGGSSCVAGQCYSGLGECRLPVP